MLRICFIFLFLPVILHAANISYTVNFHGLNDEETLDCLKKASELIALKKKKPTSLNALRFRAESDCAVLTKVLHNQGYLEGYIESRIEEGFQEYFVFLDIYPGPLYTIEEFHITLLPQNPSLTKHIQLESLGIHLGMPARPEDIVHSENRLLSLLAEYGYPLGKVEKKDIIADGKTKTVLVTMFVSTGQLVEFGPLTITGNTQVKTQLFEQKITWKQGEIYQQSKVDNTKKALIDTGLFNSVFITHEEEFNSDKQLPINIKVNENKHKSISIGATYQTTYGPGITFGWENRNVHGMGRKLSIQIDVAQRSHSGIATYLIPNCFKIGQDFLIQALAGSEAIRPYHVKNYYLQEKFERHINPKQTFSIGLKTEYLIVQESVGNGHFFVVEVPIHVRISNVSNRLDPQKGVTFEYKALPSSSIHAGTHWYLTQTAALSTYYPLFDNHLVLAQKLTLGTILSDSLHAVPISKRFFGGSEENLRGYRYYTVSPLTKKDKPKGGRSAVFYTIEPRFKLTSSWGLVPFFDLGKVYENIFPTFQKKWFKSVGIGVRYYSFIGPFRFDVAFPLNRRKDLDPRWWVFVSLGQTF